MSASLPLQGDALLQAVTDTMVTFHQRYYHRAPAHARTYLMEDDLIACVLTGVYTPVEQTLLELRGSAGVGDARSAFKEAMGPQLVGEIERLSGRRVLLFYSDTHVGPDVEVELFLLNGSL